MQSYTQHSITIGSMTFCQLPIAIEIQVWTRLEMPLYCIMDKLAEESKPSDSLYCIMDKLAEESKPSDFQLWQVRLELLLTHLYPYEIQNVDDFREENDSNLHSIHILL